MNRQTLAQIKSKHNGTLTRKCKILDLSAQLCVLRHPRREKSQKNFMADPTEKYSPPVTGRDRTIKFVSGNAPIKQRGNNCTRFFFSRGFSFQSKNVA